MIGFGVAEFDAPLQGPVNPLDPVALTLKVYAVPFVSPVTTNGDAAPVAVKHPGVDVAVYVDTPDGYAPVQAGAVKATDT